MKILVTFLIFCVTLPVFGELTKDDLEDIRKIVKEEASHVNRRVDEMNKRIDDMNKRIDDMKGLIYALIALTGVAIIVPPTVVYAMNKNGKSNPMDPTVTAKQNTEQQKAGS